MGSVTSEEVLKYLLSKDTYTVKHGALYLNGVKENKKGILGRLESDGLGDPATTIRWLKMPSKARNDTVDSVYASLVKTAAEEESASILSQLSAFSYIPVICPVTGTKMLLDKETLRPSVYDYEAMIYPMPAAVRTAFEADMQFVITAYDPYDIQPHKTIHKEGQDMLQLNTYTPPAWRIHPPTTDEVPRVFAEFFDRLFPTAECRKYIYHWLHNAILHRNETVLVLNGVKGIGKGVFCSLVKSLVGESNYTEAAVATLDTQFNSILTSKRVIVFDEIEVTKKEHTRLKRYTNDRQTIEMKGKDAKASVEVFNSYIISNNDTSDMYLEADDRRFSVAECTGVPMRLSTTSEQREELLGALNDEFLVGELGHWIIAHGKVKGWDTFTEFKGATFHKLVFNSLYNWQRFLVEYALQNREPMEYRELNKGYRKENGKDSKLPANTSKVEDFLKNYLHNGEHEVGFIKKGDDNEWYYHPTLLASIDMAADDLEL